LGLLALFSLPTNGQAQIWTTEQHNRLTTGQPDHNAATEKSDARQRQLERQIEELDSRQYWMQHQQTEADSFRREHQDDMPNNFPR
jgi:hypothetical protein